MNRQAVSEKVAYTIGDAAGKAEYDVVIEAVVKGVGKGFK